MLKGVKGVKGQMKVFLDDEESFFDFIETVMIDGVNTQNIYG